MQRWVYPLYPIYFLNALKTGFRKTRIQISDTNNRQRHEAEFSWSDDEIQLLLESALEIKSKFEFEGINWESKKYENICEIFFDRYPSTDNDTDYCNWKNKDRVSE